MTHDRHNRTFAPVALMLLPSTGLLNATKTHASRRWHFCPSAAGTPGLGVLTLVCGNEVASYAVALSPAGAFQLLKQGTGTAATHTVRVWKRGKVATCTCNGHKYAGHCRHADALKSMLAAQVLDARQPVTA